MKSTGASKNSVFSITLDLRPGIHYYKFIVDDQWQHDPDPKKQRMVNQQGVVNNVIDVQPLVPSTQGTRELSNLDIAMGDPSGFDQRVPALADFTAEPVPFPAQLQRVHLNMGNQNPSSNPGDDSELGEDKKPLSVTLKHVCFQNDKSRPDVTAVGITQRYVGGGGAGRSPVSAAKERYITTVYYKPKNRQVIQTA